LNWFQDRTKSSTSWPRRLFFNLIFGLLIAIIILNGLAWGFIWILMHPRCSSKNLKAGAPAVEIWLQTGDEGQLKAWYTAPQNGVVIISLGGLEGALGDNLPPVRFLVEHGYGALQIDSRACARPALPVTLGGREAEDVTDVLEFLHTQSEVKQIGIMGYSMGGVAAVRAAARHPEIAAVIAAGGYFNLGDHLIQAGNDEPNYRKAFLYMLTGAYWVQSGRNPWQISPIDDLPQISPRPVLLIYGEHDAPIGRAQAQFEAAREPRELWIVAGADHGQYHQMAKQEYEQRVLDFFNEALLR